MIRQALYPDYYSDMRLWTRKADEHVGHCIDTLRQSLMGTSDTNTIAWKWDEKSEGTGFRGGVAHTCRNFVAIRDGPKSEQLTDSITLKFAWRTILKLPCIEAMEVPTVLERINTLNMFCTWG